MAAYRGGSRYYSDEELELINKLKLLKGKLKRPPQIKDVDNEPGMPSSKVYIRHFGSWSQVLDTVKYSSATYDEEEAAAEELVRKVEREIPDKPKVPAIAPGLDKALDEIERQHPMANTGPWVPELKLPPKGAKKPETEDSEEKKPEKPKEKKPVEKPVEKLPEKLPEESSEKSEAQETKEADKPKTSEEETLEKTSAIGMMVDEPEKPEKPAEKVPEELVEKAPEKISETPVEKASEKASEQMILINLMGRDVILTSGSNLSRKLSAVGTVETILERTFSEEVSHEQLGSVPVFTRRVAIKENISQAYRDLPEPKKGTYYILPEEMVRSVQKTGRWTDDLLFPTTFFENENDNLIYIYRLEVISS